MQQNEIKSVESYLKKLLEKEQKGIEKKYQSFYERKRIKPKIYTVNYLDAKEYFYVILKDKKYGIYFNDIEETFGVCKINNRLIENYAEFSNDSLNGALSKMHELIESGTMEEVLL